MKQFIQAIAQRFGYFIIKRATLDELTNELAKARARMQFDQLKRRDFIALFGGSAVACTDRRSDRMISRFIGESYG